MWKLCNTMARQIVSCFYSISFKIYFLDINLPIRYGLMEL